MLVYTVYNAHGGIGDAFRGIRIFNRDFDKIDHYRAGQLRASVRAGHGVCQLLSTPRSVVSIAARSVVVVSARGHIAVAASCLIAVRTTQTTVA